MDELLSEESYQEANNKVKLIGLIIMLLGLALVGGAIYLLVNANNATVSEMKMHSNGMFMLIPGIFLTILGTIVRFVMGNQRKIMAYQMQQMLPLVAETAEKMVPTAKKMTQEMAPAYGEVAKEITKGIKEGMKEEDK